MEAACDSCAGPGDPAVGVVSYRAPPLARDQLRRPACVTTTGWAAFIVAVLGKDNTERELGWLMR